MHKSVIFLLSLLMILMPIGASMNIISNANAIASEDEYYTNEYMRYANNDDYYGQDQDRSYSYDNDYKSNNKDRNVSVSIIENNCINVNNNINGDVIGNVNVGNSARGVASNDETNEALGSNEGYHDGYQKGKEITCIANNNNNNTIIIAGNGNAINGGNETDPCIECIIENLSPEQEIALAEELAANYPTILTIEGLCEFLAEETIPPLARADTFNFILLSLGLPMDTQDDIRDCLIELGFNIFDLDGLSSSPTPTGSGLSNLPTAPSLGLP